MTLYAPTPTIIDPKTKKKVISDEPIPEEKRQHNTLIEGNILDEKQMQYYSQFMSSADSWIPRALKQKLDFKANQIIANAKALSRKKELMKEKEQTKKEEGKRISMTRIPIPMKSTVIGIGQGMYSGARTHTLIHDLNKSPTSMTSFSENEGDEYVLKYPHE